MNVLYITYDGLEDPLGQSQVLPYLEGLSRLGHRIDILSFDKPGVRTRWRERVAGGGVRWTALRYHKRPTVPATAFDLLQGLAATAAMGLLERADLLHVRSYVAGAIALPWAIAARVPLLFDTRGLWADEKVDGGAWPAGDPKYRAAKRLERALFGHADAVTVLTHAVLDYLRQQYAFRDEIAAPIQVIPTCADLRRFAPDVTPDPTLAQALDGARVLGYVGSLETWYMAETMGRFYLAWRQAAQGSPTRFLLVTRSRPDVVRGVLDAAGVSGELVVRPAAYHDVPAALRWAESALCFRKPALSSLAGAPTKIGEALACGIPVAATLTGDAAEVFRDGTAGVLVREVSDEGLRTAAIDLAALAVRPGVGASARRLAERWFDLDAGVAAYDALYRAMPRRHGGGAAARDERWPR